MSRKRKPRIVEIGPNRLRIFAGARVIGEAELIEEPSTVPVGSFWGASVTGRGIVPVPTTGFHETSSAAIAEIVSRFHGQGAGR